MLVSLRYMYVSPITSLSTLLQPIHDGRERQNAATMGNKRTASQRQNQRRTTSHCSHKPDSSASSENLQPNSATSVSRDSDYRSVLTSEDHIRCEATRQCHHTGVLRVRILARADCAQGAQKKIARSSPHCAHLHRRREDHFRHPKTFLPSHQRQWQLSQNCWLRHSLVTGGTFSTYSMHPKAFANAPSGSSRQDNNSSRKQIQSSEKLRHACTLRFLWREKSTRARTALCSAVLALRGTDTMCAWAPAAGHIIDVCWVCLAARKKQKKSGQRKTRRKLEMC